MSLYGSQKDYLFNKDYGTLILMPIYTRKGDYGETSLFSGKRVKKADLTVMLLGNLDELNAAIGLTRSLLAKQLPRNDETDSLLQSLQRFLFEIGGEIAGAENKLSEKPTVYLEKIIDRYEELLPPLKDFILPAGSKAASQCHLTRAICRRLERMLVISNDRSPLNPNVLVFFNRLSDFLFVLARKINMDEGYDEEPRRVGTNPLSVIFEE